MRLHQRLRARRRQQGFTLLEAAVALLVVGLGVLGPLKMMAHAMASSGTANARSIAALQAGALSAMVQANPAFWRDGEGANADVTLKDGRIATGSSLAGGGGFDCDAAQVTPGSAPCNAATLAVSDLVGWARSLDAALPDPGGAIRCQQTTDRLTRCTISVFWHERFVSANGVAAASHSAATGTAENGPRSFITHLSF